jgi:hypothetical protein
MVGRRAVAAVLGMQAEGIWQIAADKGCWLSIRIRDEKDRRSEAEKFVLVGVKFVMAPVRPRPQDCLVSAGRNV